MVLLLVKHSLPEIRRDAPPSSWRLSDEGRERARRLADYVISRDVSRVVSSPEPKAIETAEAVAGRVGLEVEVREGLHEHELAGEWFDDRESFDEAVVRFFQRPEERVLGKETASEAALRFSRAMDGVLSETGDGSLVVVSHGRVMSLYAAPRFGEDVAGFWRRLGLPALVELDFPGLSPLSVVERF